MQIELIPIKNLTLLEKNPRRITKEQMEKLCKSIQDDPEFLMCRPVLVNKKEIHWQDHSGKQSKETLEVYAGNQRVRAAKKLKMKEIPCIVDHDLPDRIQDARCIKDNKTYGEFDFDILSNDFYFDIEMLIECGFKSEELIGDLSNISDDERVEEEKEKKSKECPHCGGKL